MPLSRLWLEHLPADVFGLAPIARHGLAQGPDFAPLPVARRPKEVPQPTERHALTERDELARRLRGPIEALDPPTRVLSSLTALEQEGVFAVVTGQQPGLLGAPLYTLYKAMQACRLAHELSLIWGRPVVPMFWNHGDDHDVAEVNRSWQLNRNLDIQKVALAGLSSGRQPLSRIVLDEERHALAAVRNSLRQTYGDHVEVETALELFVPRAGETLVRAVSRCLTQLLGAHGLVVVEPDWIRAELSRGLARVVASSIEDALQEGARVLREAGEEVVLDPREAALVYRVTDEGRRALRLGGEGFRYDGETGSRTAEELAAEILEQPEHWSAGALLRPLAQDFALPTSAYIGGMAELAYHAQLGPLRDARDLPRLPFVPRVSVTLVEPEVRNALDKLSIELRGVLEARGNLDQLVTSEPTPAVIEALRAAAERAAEDLRRHGPELAAIDPSMGPNLARTASQVKNLVEKLLAKAERVHQNSSGKGRRHLRRLANTLFPRDEPQERVLGPFSFVARWGPSWIEALFAEMPAIAPEHIVAHFEEEESA